MASQNVHLRAIVNQDGAAVLDTQAGTISTFNQTGAYIWQALERGEDLETIAANLARETGEQVDVVLEDVRDFIDALEKHNLLPRR